MSWYKRSSQTLADDNKDEDAIKKELAAAEADQDEEDEDDDEVSIAEWKILLWKTSKHPEQVGFCRKRAFSFVRRRIVLIMTAWLYVHDNTVKSV